jgi:putative aldouronate transport system permease protein
MAYKENRIERIFDIMNIFVLSILGLATLYPFIYILSASFSVPEAVARREVFLYPIGFTLKAYRLVFRSNEVLLAYYNTIWYTVVGTLINVLMTTSAAYPLSRKNFSLRSIIMVYITITMFFSGGLIPFYILVNRLGLYNTRWALVIPGAVSAWNLMMARVFFQTTIPDELIDAAKIDGANEITIFFRIVLPLSKPILAVLALYYGVAHWNDFFGPLIFLSDPKLQPLSIYLRKVLIQAQLYSGEYSGGLEQLQGMVNYALVEQVKYATVIVALLPIMMSYPFLQKYFVKGVMIGALKE